jgi:hypothetical protein
LRGLSGVAISSNGLDWIRGSDRITGEKGVEAASDVGLVMEPNKDWCGAIWQQILKYVIFVRFGF